MDDDDRSIGRFGIDQRTIRSLRLFANPPGSPRSRRPTDTVLLVVGALVLLVASWSAEPPGSLSNDVTQLVADTPAWVLSIWQTFFDFLVVWAALLIVAAVLRGHFLVASSAVGATIVGLLLAYVSQRIALAEPVGVGDVINQFTASEGPAEFPGVRLMAGTAVLVVMSPSLSRPFRFFGRIVLLVGFLASVGLGVATVAGSIGGLAAGVAGASAIHLVVGSPGGRPTRRAIRLALTELGVRVDDLEPAELEPAGLVLMNATSSEGRRLSVKVYGRDAWDGQLIAKLWRWLWYRDGRTALLLSRLHQVEHEALITVLAERAGTPVPHVLVAGAATGNDTAIVTTADGVPLSALAEGDGRVTDDLVAELWRAIESAHGHGIVHGSLDARHVTLRGDGSPLITDWAAGSVAAPRRSIDEERAQMLVLTALLVGPERSIAAAGRTLGTDALGRVVPYLQTAVLPSGLRRDVRAAEFDIDELREKATEAAGVEKVELVELRRVTVRSVLSMALVVVAAVLLISSISDIGIETIVDELANASWGWVLVALAVAQFARVFNAVGTTGATDHPLRLGPTVVLEFAITFVNLVVPSSAARFATKMRYFQKAGMTLTSATAMGAIDSLAGFSVQIVVLVAALLFGLGGIEFDFDFDEESAQNLLILVGIVVVVAVAVAGAALAFVPSARERVAGPLRQLRDSLRVVRSPMRLLRLFGGNLLAELTFASVLGLSLVAYGESAPLMSLLVINVAVALLAGLMPVPGGVGVTEAAFTAGLIAIGIPESTAFAAAITTRLCTFYLPPIWGYFAMRWLRHNQYL